MRWNITADRRITRGFKKVYANEHSNLSSHSLRLKEREEQNQTKHDKNVQNEDNRNLDVSVTGTYDTSPKNTKVIVD